MRCFVNKIVIDSKHLTLRDQDGLNCFFSTCFAPPFYFSPQPSQDPTVITKESKENKCKTYPIDLNKVLPNIFLSNNKQVICYIRTKTPIFTFYKNISAFSKTWSRHAGDLVPPWSPKALSLWSSSSGLKLSDLRDKQLRNVVTHPMRRTGFDYSFCLKAALLLPLLTTTDYLHLLNLFLELWTTRYSCTVRSHSIYT